MSGTLFVISYPGDYLKDTSTYISEKNIKSRLETALLLVKNRVILFLENMKGGCQMKQAVQVSSNLFKMTSPLIVHNIRDFN